MSQTTANDEGWIAHALALAEKGVGLASPNPTVGCVLVDRENLAIGEGFHQYALRDHAEVVALRDAGDRARKATAYVTLEPCSHQGRTGPCTDALIAAGVCRVVISTLDANPVVRGKGVQRLRDAGIPVQVGIGRPQTQRLNDAFAKYIRTGRPYVTLKAALSLDGRIAPAPEARVAGAPFWLTGSESRAQVQRLRHAHDALLTGIGTVLADDPQLTDRSGQPRRQPLMRVVLDSRLRLPDTSKLVATHYEDNTFVFTGDGHPNESRIAELASRGVRVERFPASPDGLPLEQILSRLGELGITSVLIEAGTHLNTTALATGIVDRLVLFYAPVLLGAAGLPLVHGLAGARPLPSPEVSRFGDDVCLTSTLRTYWDE